MNTPYAIASREAERLSAKARPLGLAVHFSPLKAGGCRSRNGIYSARPWQLWSVHPRRGIVTGFRTAFASPEALEAHLAKLQQRAISTSAEKLS